MKDFISQTNKNGILLLDKGLSQFSGAENQSGIFECMNNYNYVFEQLNFNDKKISSSDF